MATRQSTIIALAAGMAACGPEPARPQLIVWVDTDAPVHGQVIDRPELSVGAAVDTLRIDVLGGAGEVTDVREVVAPSPLDWPVGFGVVTTAAERVRFRLRAFHGALASPDPDHAVLRPPPEVAIDRVVELELPSDRVAERQIVLSLACMGARPSFVSPPRTCIDAEERSGPIDAAIAEAPAPTRVGSSPLAHEVACLEPSPPGAGCIPGGFSLLGDLRMTGLADLFLLDSAPLKAVWVSPFHMDVTEVTVGRFRQLVLEGRIAGTLPAMPDPSQVDFVHCTWRGSDESASDAFPLNCLSAATAEEICLVSGGRLPSEAEWEHAARGRGQGRDYPWGDLPASCCMVNAGQGTGNCTGSGLVPAGTSLGQSCAAGDVSRDGILDLGGSLIELMRDAALSYAAPCWEHHGVARDPLCTAPEGGVGPAARGGSFDTSLTQTLSALRKRAVPSAVLGVRCVYEDRP